MKHLYLITLGLLVALLLCSCKSEQIFGDYSLTYSFSSEHNEVSSSTSSESSVSTTSSQAIVNTAEILDFKNNIKPGQSASISIKGKPNTLYSIEVHYASGPSSSKSLNDKTSDNDGIVFWEWRVGINTKPGDYDVFISDDTGRVVETMLTVISKG